MLRVYENFVRCGSEKLRGPTEAQCIKMPILLRRLLKMIISPLLYAAISVMLAAFMRILRKHFVVTGYCPYLCLGFEHLVAFVFLLAVFGLPHLNTFNNITLFFLAAQTALWIPGSILNMKAMRTLEAASCEIFSTFDLFIGSLGGILIFQEGVSVLKSAGLAMVFLAMISMVTGRKGLDRQGVLLQMASSIFVAAAFIVEKQLCLGLDVQTVALAGYLGPGLYFILRGRSSLKALPALIRMNIPFLLFPFISGLSYYCFIQALSGSSIISVLVLSRSVSILVLILEISLLQCKENLFRRTTACLACCLGAICVCLS